MTTTMETITTDVKTFWEARARLAFGGPKAQRYVDALDDATNGIDLEAMEPNERFTLILPPLYRLAIYRQTGITLVVTTL